MPGRGEALQGREAIFQQEVHAQIKDLSMEPCPQDEECRGPGPKRWKSEWPHSPWTPNDPWLDTALLVPTTMDSVGLEVLVLRGHTLSQGTQLESHWITCCACCLYTLNSLLRDQWAGREVTTLAARDDPDCQDGAG